MSIDVWAKFDVLEQEIKALGRRAALWQFGFWVATGLAIIGWLR